MLAIAMVFGLISFSFAQNTAAKSVKSAPEKKEAKKAIVKPDTKVSTASQANKQISKPVTTAKAPAATSAKPAAKSGTVLKKDGTPDKRYSIAKNKVPLKKDGTPDKRFKENKKSKR